MRPRALVIVPLLLAACIVIPVRVKTVKSFAVGAAQDAIINAAIDQLHEDGKTEVGRLRVVGLSPEAFVSKSEATRVVNDVRSKLLEQFRGPQYAGIHADLANGLDTEVNRFQLRYAKESVPKRSVFSVVDSMMSFARELFRRPDKRISFYVTSNPTGATFEICPQYLNQGCFPLTTDGLVDRLVRGYYTYRIQLAGYKPVAYNIDLVPFSRKKLRCILQPQDSRQLAGPCTPE